MKKKVIILGATGMLGHQVYHRLTKEGNFEITNVCFRNKLKSDSVILDLHKKQEVEALIEKVQPDYIINCVGVLIQGANQNPANAIYLNSYLPHFLAELGDKFGAKLIHVSTDCVFSGEKGGYTENDEKDGKDIYAKTKALGEVENSDHLTLRTSIIGPELKKNGEGLFHWFMQQQDETNGFTKAIWSGVTTYELAQTIISAIDQGLNGLYHVTNGESINKYDLLNLFKKHSGKDISINKVDGKAVDKSFIDTRKELNREIPTYDKMIEQMILNMSSNPELYQNYQIK